MSEQFDAVVIGAGIAGETCAQRLRDAGRSVALVERDLIGGECAYWASIPSKTLFGPANLLWRAQQIAGIHSPAVGGPHGTIPRDALLPALDDAAQMDALQRTGIVVIRGNARVLSAGRIEVAGRLLETEHLVLATGSAPRIPDIAGLAASGYWTNREATAFKALPQSVLVLGGESQAIELAQMFRLFGADVTLITKAARLIAHEDAEAAALITRYLYQSGIRVLVDHSLTEVARDDEGAYVALLDTGERIVVQALVVAGSRMPRTMALGDGGDEARVTERGIQVDERCRAAEGIWAIGDVTGVLPLSHIALYQAHIAADDILGQTHPAQYLSVPRIYFTEPQIAATGLTLAGIQERQRPVSSVTVALGGSVPRALGLHKDLQGQLTLHADRERGVLVGAWAVAPDASEWIQLAALAIRAAIPLAIFHDTLEQFPAFNEPCRVALEYLMRASTGPQSGS